MVMALYVFSDAHLGSGSADQEQIKLARMADLFARVREDGDRLIILGDLFDFWFEYKHAIPKEAHPALMMLSDVRRSGVTIEYVAGNHDFWMDDFFSKYMGITVHRDHMELDYRERRLYLCHGDGLAPADRGYRLLKKVLRNRFNIWLYRKLPPDWAIPLAKKVSGSSREYTARRDHTFKADYERFARQRLSEGYDVVLIGHLHIPQREQYESGVYINTGDFIHHFSYARIDQDQVQLLTL
jgi:UDP-2,3-diacylglucosamine hydrolase